MENGPYSTTENNTSTSVCLAPFKNEEQNFGSAQFGEILTRLGLVSQKEVRKRLSIYLCSNSITLAFKIQALPDFPQYTLNPKDHHNEISLVTVMSTWLRCQHYCSKGSKGACVRKAQGIYYH